MVADLVSPEVHSEFAGGVIALGDIDSPAKRAELTNFCQDGKVALGAMADHIKTFLASPNRRVGRPGTVCPYIPGAISHSTVYLAVSSVADQVSDSSISEVVRGMLRVFPRLDPVESQLGTHDERTAYKCLVVLFPTLPAQNHYWLSQVQARRKLEFMRRGYMLGEMFPGCVTEGLHNPQFRPFDVPVPAIGVRYMTEYDVPFCVSDDASLFAYLERFGPVGTRRVKAYAAKGLTGADRVRLLESTERYLSKLHQQVLGD
jgi:uncharacterized protein DUF6875